MVDLVDQVSNELEKEVLRRYAPYLTDKAVQLSDERISVFPSQEIETLSARKLDQWSADVAIQVAQTLPESGDQTSVDPDADFNQLEFLDERMATVESIKELFRDEGVLRESKIGGCYFNGLAQSRPYDLKGLTQHRIFSSVIVLTFVYTGE